MQEKGAVLTREERDVLILAGAHPNYQHLNNTEIARRLDIPVSKVKTLLHQACVKLGANNRNNAILTAVVQGEITLDEFLSLDELAELVSALHPDTLRTIAGSVQEWLEHGCLPGEDEQIIPTDRRQDTLLTKGEQNVLALVARGLTNREIADTLYVSIMITIAKVEDDQVTIDGNHPLAGMQLHFEVTIIDVRDATEQEIEHGHVHQHGHDH